MQGLARATDGNHVFVERPDDLVRFFDLEFGEVLSVVAQDADVRIRCEAGVRPVRVLGREADIVGNEVTLSSRKCLRGKRSSCCWSWSCRRARWARSAPSARRP
ncbi:MAG: hypothetical protein R3F43_10765 [bacterium]